MVVLLVAIELLLIYEVRRRVHTITAFDAIAAYIVLCQVSFFLAQYLPVVNIADPGQFRSFLRDNDAGQLLFFGIFAMLYASTLGLGVAATAGVRETSVRILGRLESWLPATLAICAAAAMIDAFAIDQSIAWYNTRYLLIGTSAGLAVQNTLTTLIHSGAQTLGIVALFGFSMSLFTGRRLMTLGFLPVVAWYVLVALATSSRNAAIFAFIPALVAAVVLHRWRWPVALSFVGLALIFLLMALVGRNMGRFGFSMIGDYFVAAVQTAPDRGLQLLANLTQGIFVTNDGFLLNPQHQDLYKVLSFSPLPSFIDGFDDIRRIMEIRLHYYVPMSAITEVIAFGPSYAAAAALTFMLLVRLCIVAAKRRMFALSLLMSGWTFLIFVQATAYPLRNVYRQGLIAIAVLVAVLYLVRWTRRGRTTAIGTAAAGAE